jgi:hypothetical protein
MHSGFYIPSNGCFSVHTSVSMNATPVTHRFSTKTYKQRYPSYYYYFYLRYHMLLSCTVGEDRLFCIEELYFLGKWCGAPFFCVGNLGGERRDTAEKPGWEAGGSWCSAQGLGRAAWEHPNMHSHSTLPEIASFFIIQEAQTLQMSREHLLTVYSSICYSDHRVHQTVVHCRSLFSWQVFN